MAGKNFPEAAWDSQAGRPPAPAHFTAENLSLRRAKAHWLGSWSRRCQDRNQTCSRYSPPQAGEMGAARKMSSNFSSQLHLRPERRELVKAEG